MEQIQKYQSGKMQSVRNFIALLFSFLLGGLVSLTIGVPLLVALVVSLLLTFCVAPLVKIERGSLNISLGPLTASAPTLFTLPYVPSLILVGTTDTDLPVDSITTNIAGVNYQVIDDQNVIQAISKLFLQGLLGADVKVAQIWKVAGGQSDLKDGQKFRLTIGNVGVTTPTVYAYSQQKGGSFVEIGQDSINARGNAIIQGVTSLLFEDTNFSKADITFLDGHTESDLSLAEIASMLAQDYTCDADGKLAGVNVINFVGNNIASVKLYAGTGGSLGYYMVTI